MTDGPPPPALPPPPPLSGLTFAQRGLLKGLHAWITLLVIVGCVGLCTWNADWLVLRWHYDEDQIRRDRLHIVARKPVRISNGDDLGRAPWPQPLLFTVGWMGPTVVILTMLTFAVPRRCRAALAEESDVAYESSPLWLWAASLLTSVPLLFFAVATDSYIPPLVSFSIAGGVLVGIRRTFADDRDAPAAC